MKAKQATNIFKRNSLFFKANIKVSFVALNQIRHESKNERDLKRIVFGQLRDCCVHKIAHTPQTAIFSRSFGTILKTSARWKFALS